jgi:hypothetical protein
MIEGWAQDRHFIVFTDEEAAAATTRYGLSYSLPGYVIVGILGWDDFILRSKTHELFTVPTVPAIAKYLEPFLGELPRQLEADDRARTVKWYVNPIAFGGNPEPSENMIWVTHDQHAELVRWWNKQYHAALLAAAAVQLTLAADTARCLPSVGATISRAGCAAEA